MVAGLTTKSIGVEGDTALTAYVQGIAKLDDEFDKAIAKGASVTAATAKYEEGVKALGDTLDNTRKKQQTLTDEATAQFKAGLDQQNAAMQRSIDLQVQSVGMSAKEIQRAQQLLQIREQGIRQINQYKDEEAQLIAQAGPDADTSKIKAIYDERIKLAKEATD